MSKLPLDWKQLSIGEIFSPDAKGVNPSDLGEVRFRYYSLPNFDLDKTATITKGSDIESNKIEFSKATILIAKLNPRIPRIWLVPENNSERKICSTEFIVANNISSENSLEFFYYYFQSNKVINYLESVATGSTNSHKRFRPDDLFEIVGNFPSLADQIKIAKILSSVDAVINLQSIEIKKLKFLRQGIISKLLTAGLGHKNFKQSEIGKIPNSWEVKDLRDICNIEYGKSPKDVTVEQSNYKIWGTGGVNGYASNYTFKGPFILLGRKGTIDNPILVNESAWVIDTAFGVSAKEGYLLKYIYYILCHAKLEKLNEATGVPSLSREALYNFKVAVAIDLNEQKKIVMQIEAVDKKINLTEKKLNANMMIKKGLMSDFFSGKIRVSKEVKNV